VGAAILGLAGSILLGTGGQADLLSLTRLTTLTLKPDRVIAGGSVRATVTLDRAAPAGGTTILLASNSKRASVPASVVIPGGQRAATFLVRTTKGPGPVVVRIGALRGRDLRVALLRIEGPAIAP
jgi:hypothetical protein